MITITPSNTLLFLLPFCPVFTPITPSTLIVTPSTPIFTPRTLTFTPSTIITSTVFPTYLLLHKTELIVTSREKEVS